MPIENNQWTKHISLVIRYKLPGWPNVGTHQSTLEGINLALQVLHLKFHNWGPLTPVNSSFYTPNPDVIVTMNVIIQKPHIIGTSPHDVLMMSYLLLAEKSVHVPGYLSRGSRSEQNAEANALIGPPFEEGNGNSRCTLWDIYTSVQRLGLKIHPCAKYWTW